MTRVLQPFFVLPQINGITLEERTHSDAVDLFRTAGANVELRVLKKVGVTMLQDLFCTVFFIFHGLYFNNCKLSLYFGSANTNNAAQGD